MATVTFKHDPPPARTPKFRKGDYASRIDSIVLVTDVDEQSFSGVVLRPGNSSDLEAGDINTSFNSMAWDVFHGKINIET